MVSKKVKVVNPSGLHLRPAGVLSQTFRAGTIGTLADKTAYGFVAHYYEDKGIRKRRCEIERIVSGCVPIVPARKVCPFPKMTSV